MTNKHTTSKKHTASKAVLTQPTTKERISKLPLSITQRSAVFVCLATVILVGSFFHYRVATTNTLNEKKTALETQQQNTGIQVDKLTKTATNLQANLERLDLIDTEIRQIISLGDATTPPRPELLSPSDNFKNQGGPLGQTDISDLNKLTNDLQSKLKLREQNLVQLKQELLKKQANLANTPSIWPITGEVTSPFGWRNSPWGTGSDFHPGIDIAKNIGAPVFATADGDIIRSEWAGGYGNLVEIDHKNGISTLYGHNSQIIVSAGQSVKKGQIIAYVGSTGNSTGPHVHYEVRVNGNVVNPDKFLMLN